MLRNFRETRPSLTLLEVAHFGVAKRRKQVALGVSPRIRAILIEMSREAAAETACNESGVASRLNVTVARFLGLTPEAIRYRRFATHEMAQPLNSRFGLLQIPFFNRRLTVRVASIQR